MIYAMYTVFYLIHTTTLQSEHHNHVECLTRGNKGYRIIPQGHIFVKKLCQNSKDKAGAKAGAHKYYTTLNSDIMRKHELSLFQII